MEALEDRWQWFVCKIASPWEAIVRWFWEIGHFLKHVRDQIQENRTQRWFQRAIGYRYGVTPALTCNSGAWAREANMMLKHGQLRQSLSRFPLPLAVIDWLVEHWPAERLKPLRLEVKAGDYAYIDGRDPEAVLPLTVERINLWDSLNRKKVVARLRHGTRVKVIGRALHSTEKRHYCLVRSWWRWGWVPEVFLSPQREKVIGELV